MSESDCKTCEGIGEVIMRDARGEEDYIACPACQGLGEILLKQNKTELNIYNKIIKERERQKEDHPYDQLNPPTAWIGILAKQLGQAAEQTIRDDIDIPRLEKQLIQISAVCVAWLEILEWVRLNR